MEFTETTYNGFKQINFKFEDRLGILVCPKEPLPGNKWLYKIEYFDAFPKFEVEMLEKGYYVAHMSNKTRWSTPADIEMWPKFCDFLIEHFGLNPKCFPVGLSCGGAESVFFASYFPQYVAAMYLDAPVMNFLSCPYGLGDSEADFIEEFEKATGFTLKTLLSHRNHPLDHIADLLKHRIPILIISGDADKTVPYDENGKYLTEYYRQNGGIIEEIIRPGGDHHPCGLDDGTPMHEFVEKYYP